MSFSHVCLEANDATGALDIAETDSATIEVQNLTFAPALSKLIVSSMSLIADSYTLPKYPYNGREFC